jgi:hypothetical protein
VLLLACYWLLPASAPARRSGLDLPGAVTGTAGVALIVLAVARAGLAATRLAPAARIAGKPPAEHKFLHHAGGIP